MASPALTLRSLGLRDYDTIWRAMREFTRERDASTPDEIWLLQHRAVFTLGQAGRREHIIGATGEVPVVQTDRGGQVTYHGPGQVIAYLLLDLRRRNTGVRDLVTRIEQAVIALLAGYGISAEARADARGVYVQTRKIAALGLRVRHGCSYHGLSLNVDMDLSPFALINPCGYAGLEVTRTVDLGVARCCDEIGEDLVAELIEQLGYNAAAVRRYTELAET